MSVTDLAVAAGLDKKGRGYISRVEHGSIRSLAEGRLACIAAALQVSISDLVQHRMPEAQGELPAHDLEEAVIGARALLSECVERSFDWARLQLLLARLHVQRAAASQVMSVRYNALSEARICLACALPVFTANKTPRSFAEATQLAQNIADLLESLIIPGSLALLQRCAPGSLDWARIQVLRAKFFSERALVLPDQTARAVLAEAQCAIEAALPIFTRLQAQRSLSEASRLYQEIISDIQQLDGS
jgi:transcriptional regulator with XRE-family HTH domain